jgi:predicted DNA repair protein MutK
MAVLTTLNGRLPITVVIREPLLMAGDTFSSYESADYVLHAIVRSYRRSDSHHVDGEPPLAMEIHS